MREVVARTVPRALWGSAANERAVLRAVASFAALRRHEDSSVDAVLRRLRTSDVAWLQPAAPGKRFVGFVRFAARGATPKNFSFRRRRWRWIGRWESWGDEGRYSKRKLREIVGIQSKHRFGKLHARVMDTSLTPRV